MRSLSLTSSSPLPHPPRFHHQTTLCNFAARNQLIRGPVPVRGRGQENLRYAWAGALSGNRSLQKGQQPIYDHVRLWHPVFSTRTTSSRKSNLIESSSIQKNNIL